jgi:hypothetical protein
MQVFIGAGELENLFRELLAPIDELVSMVPNRVIEIQCLSTYIMVFVFLIGVVVR